MGGEGVDGSIPQSLVFHLDRVQRSSSPQRWMCWLAINDVFMFSTRADPESFRSWDAFLLCLCISILPYALPSLRVRF